MKSSIKYIGGKANEIKYFKKYIPEYDLYVEPFFGGGSVLFDLCPEKAIINDNDKLVIKYWKSVKYDPENLINNISKYENKIDKDSYYKIRNLYNKGKVSHEDAFYFYINRIGFRGLVRRNKKGEINTPYRGNIKLNKYYNIIRQNSNCLISSKINCKDYKIFLEKLEKENIVNNKTFIFIDPPYIDTYSYSQSKNEVISIYKYLSKYIKRTKAKVMIITKESGIINKLFNGYIIDNYNKKYVINSCKIKNTKHLIITNY